MRGKKEMNNSKGSWSTWTSKQQLSRGAWNITLVSTNASLHYADELVRLLLFKQWLKVEQKSKLDKHAVLSAGMLFAGVCLSTSLAAERCFRANREGRIFHSLHLSPGCVSASFPIQADVMCFRKLCSRIFSGALHHSVCPDPIPLPCIISGLRLWWHRLYFKDISIHL